MLMNSEHYWNLSEVARDHAYPPLDNCCLVCGESLEGKTFVAWLFMGPQLHAAGMHPRCAYAMSMGILKDLAAVEPLAAPYVARALSQLQSDDHNSQQQEQQKLQPVGIAAHDEQDRHA